MGVKSTSPHRRAFAGLIAAVMALTLGALPAKAADLGSAAIGIAKNATRIRPAGNVATRIFGGRMGSIDNTTQQTYQVTLTTELPYDAVRVIFANSSTSSYTVSAAGVNSPTQSVDYNNSSNAGTSVTVGGAASFTVAAAPSIDRQAFTISDWIALPAKARTDGGKFNLLTIRAYVSTSTGSLSVVGNGTDGLSNWAGRSDGRRWIMRKQAGDQVTTWSGFTSTTNINQSPIVGVQYVARGRVVSVVGFGDSITEGRGTYIGEGWGYKACADLSDSNLGVAFEWSNIGWSGQNSTQFYQRALDALAAFSDQPWDIAFIPNYTPNDNGATPNSVSVAASAARSQLLTGRARQYGTQVIQWTGLPTNAALYNIGSADASRINTNAAYVSTYANRGLLVADFSAQVQNSTPLGTGQYEFSTGLTDDNIHPNDTGNAAIAGEAKRVILRALGNIPPRL